MDEERIYEWYGSITDGSLSQGDIFTNYPLFVPDSSSASPADTAVTRVSFRRQFYTVIVLSQSCDIVRPKIRNVLICPIQPFLEAVETEDSGIKKKDYDQIRKGYRHAHHILNRCTIPGFEHGPMLVNFGMVATTDYSTLERFAEESGPRIRLLPPYREHLSQAFARFIMRVGLPQDVEGLS